MLGTKIAEKMLETLDHWGVKKEQVLLIITDNGSNMAKAVRLMKEEFESDADDETDSDDDNGDQLESDTAALPSSFRALPCLAHSLQLTVKELRHDPGYVSLVEKARALVRKVRMSSVATEKLCELAGKGLITDCTTRWNSTLQMMQRLLDVRATLAEVLNIQKIDNLACSEWDRLETLCNILIPFAIHTDTLQKDSCALSQVIPALLDLDVTLEDIIDGDPDVVGEAKGKARILRTALQKRFAHLLDPEHSPFEVLPAAACILDYQTAPFLLSSNPTTTMEKLASAAKAYIIRQVELNTG